MKKNNTYTFEQKKNAVIRHINDGVPMNQIAKEYGTAAATIYQWIKKFEEGGDEALKTDRRGRKKVEFRETRKKLSNEEEILILKKEVESLKKTYLALAEQKILQSKKSSN